MFPPSALPQGRLLRRGRTPNVARAGAVLVFAFLAQARLRGGVRAIQSSLSSLAPPGRQAVTLHRQQALCG
eukprot:788940-Alexandrium_andersonii.AAC.1